MNQQERNPSKIGDLQNSQNPAVETKKIISESISKSLRRSPFNKLLITSQSLSMVRPVAMAYLDEFPKKHQPYDFQVILLDFNEEEVDYIQEILRETIFLYPKKDYFSADVQNGFKITKLSKQLVQKRKYLYLQPGIFSITTQIFLTDLLRGYKQLSTGLRLKIIVKLTDKIQTYYDYIAWITTILKIKEKQLNQGEGKVTFIYICTKPNHYKDKEELSRIYRTFFCKKIVIWPFGRSQIHKALTQFRRESSLKQWQYTLFLSEGEKKLHQNLMEFYYFLKKSHSKKNHTNQHQSDYILYSSAIEEGFSITRGENNEFQHVKILLLHLLNSNKITLLNTVTRFIQLKDCQLWNSNNSEVIGLIQNLLNQLQSSIFRYQRRENNHFVDLKKILSNYKGIQFQFNSQKQNSHICQYPLSISIVIAPQTNQKITEIINIIEKIIDHKPETAQQNQEQIPPQMKQLIKKLEQNSPLKQNSCHNTLIMCSTESIARFIRQQLHGYILQRNYANYLRQLHRYLSSNRLFRIKKIKKIYDKKKIKKQEPLEEASKKNQQKSINLQQTKQIIKQILCQQIEKFNQIILNYELKSTIINQQQQQKSEQTTSQQFDLNRQESSLLQSVQKQLFQSSFLCINPQLIKFPYSPLDVKSFYLETNNTRKKIIVECQNGSKYRSIQPSYFDQILQYYNPSTIIFYSPSPILLRSLYINQIEAEQQKLKNVHILSFENSYETKKAAFQVTKQDQSFWNISQNRSQLPQFIQSPYERIKPLNYRDSIEMGRNQINSKDLFREENSEGTSISSILQIQIKRKILVDTREFKSSLPSYLYHSGFQVIPVFLKSADYIISEDAAIEKKSIHTRDLQGSIKDNRLEAQLKGMSANFRHPYLLIECDQQTDFVKHNFAIIDGSYASKGRFQLRKKLMQLLHKFPNVRVIWSTSVAQTCELIKKLKEDRHQPDISKYVKQQSKDFDLPQVIQVSSKKEEEENDV